MRQKNLQVHLALIRLPPALSRFLLLESRELSYVQVFQNDDRFAPLYEQHDAPNSMVTKWNCRAAEPPSR